MRLYLDHSCMFIDLELNIIVQIPQKAPKLLSSGRLALSPFAQKASFAEDEICILNWTALSKGLLASTGSWGVMILGCLFCVEHGLEGAGNL